MRRIFVHLQGGQQGVLNIRRLDDNEEGQKDKQERGFIFLHVPNCFFIVKNMNGGKMSSFKNTVWSEILGWSPSKEIVAFDAPKLALESGAESLDNEFSIKNKEMIYDPAEIIRIYGEYLDHKFKTMSEDIVGEPDEVIRIYGELAMNRAKRMWLEKVIDPPSSSDKYERSRNLIDKFIRTEDGLNWGWEEPYEKDGDFAWCGSFAAYAWGQVGLNLKLRYRYFASTYRLDRYARYKPAIENTTPVKPENNARKYLRLDKNSGLGDVLEFNPSPGDILLVGRKNYGSHVTIVERFIPESQEFITLEGNAKGNGPYGKQYEGVIRTKRPLGLSGSASSRTSHARRLIRPSIHDITNSD